MMKNGPEIHQTSKKVGPLAPLPVYRTRNFVLGKTDLPGEMAAHQLLMALCFDLYTWIAIDLTRQLARRGQCEACRQIEAAGHDAVAPSPYWSDGASGKPSRNLQAEWRLPEGVGTPIWGAPPDS